MAEKRTIELEVVSNSENAQKQFKDLRSTIKSTTEQIEELTKEFGENSNEVSEAKKRLNELKNSYTELSKSATDLSASFEDVYGEMQPLSARMGEAEDRLYELAAAGKQGTKEYRDLLEEVGKFKRVQMETDMVVDAASSTMANKMLGALGGVASGAEVATGAMGLFGVESEEVEQAMLKVQSAMALTQGIQGLKEAQGSFKQLGAVASKTFKSLSSESSLAGKATSALGPVWKAVGLSGKTALSGIRAGIAATGIGLLVVALGAVVAYWDDIKAAVGGVSSEMEKNLELSHQQVENAQSEVELFDLQANSLKLQGKSEEEILKLRQGKLKILAKEQEEDIKLAENKKKLEVEAAKRNKSLLEAYLTLQIESIMLPFRALAGLVDGTMATVNAGLRALGQDEIKFKSINSYMTEFREYAVGGLSKMVFDPEGIAKEGEASIKAMRNELNKTKSEIDGAELAIQGIKKGSSEKQSKDKKEADTSMTEYLNALEAERQANIKDAREKELQEAANKYDELTALADKAGQSTTEIDKKYIEQRAEINKRFDTLEKEERAKAEAEALEKMIAADAAAFEIEKTNRQLRIDGMKEGKEKELEVIDLAYDSELLALNNQLDAKTLSEEEYQKQKVLMEEKYGSQIAETNKKFDEEDKARREAALQRNADLAKSGLSAISDLTELFGKKSEKQAKRAFQIKKAASISSALIDTFLSARSAYLSQFTPVPDPSSPVRGGIAAGIAVATGLIGVAKIASQKFDGGGSVSGGGGASGGGGGMGGGSQAPSFNVVGNNGLNQLAQLQQQPTQAYVVSGQVTTAQSLDRNRVQNATL
jgi:hypothetical protein